MRLLLTGASGFVAPHVARAARQRFGDSVSIIGAAISEATHPDIGELHALDIRKRDAVSTFFSKHKPTHVIHLAGISAPPAAEVDYEQAWDVNVLGALRCARALAATTVEGVFVFAGSAQVYGQAQGVNGPLTEDVPLVPASEYASTKAAADLALGALRSRGPKIVRFRPFNHTGPGQSEDFVVPRFAGQIARIEAGKQPPTLRVGNLEGRRDFVDVRDIANAYVTALVEPVEPPAVFNLASGRAESIRWILDYLVGLARVPVNIEVDPALWRADEANLMIGDAARARADLGWRPALSLEQTLADVLEQCRAVA
jgi:GDP-4-dehydro-6-deoxy-D-mannose reductase